MQLTCPRCRRGLLARDGVDECAHCGGIWFDRGELELAVSHREPPPLLPPAAPETDVRYLPCPRCQKFMTRRAYRRISGVVLDECNTHGTWADQGEVERIVAFEAGEGPERLAVKEADEARLEEERRRDATARWERVRRHMVAF